MTSSNGSFSALYATASRIKPDYFVYNCYRGDNIYDLIIYSIKVMSLERKMKLSNRLGSEIDKNFVHNR